MQSSVNAITPGLVEMTASSRVSQLTVCSISKLLTQAAAANAAGGVGWTVYSCYTNET